MPGSLTSHSPWGLSLIHILYRNLALGLLHLIDDGVALSLPAGIYHLKLDVAQAGLVGDLIPYGILLQVAVAVGGLDTIFDIRSIYAKDQIQVFSREAALAGQVRVDCDTQFVIRVFTSEEDVALSIHVPASGSHSAEGVTAAVSSLIGALIDGQSYHIAINLNIRSFYLAEVRICGTTIIQGEVGSCQDVYKRQIHVSGLIRCASPAVSAGLQNEQALALFVRDIEPTALLKELGGVNIIRNCDYGKVRTNGCVLRDINLNGTAFADCLGKVAGQRKLCRLAEIVRKLRDGIDILCLRENFRLNLLQCPVFEVFFVDGICIAILGRCV